MGRISVEFRHSRAWLNHDLVHVTPSPVFTGLERSNKGVMGLSEVPGRVFIFRGVAATHVPAGKAQSQVDPRVTHLQALLASGGVGRHILYLVKV